MDAEQTTNAEQLMKMLYNMQPYSKLPYCFAAPYRVKLCVDVVFVGQMDSLNVLVAIGLKSIMNTCSYNANKSQCMQRQKRKHYTSKSKATPRPIHKEASINGTERKCNKDHGLPTIVFSLRARATVLGQLTAGVSMPTNDTHAPLGL